MLYTSLVSMSYLTVNPREQQSDYEDKKQNASVVLSYYVE